MFFARRDALAGLDAVANAVRPGGHAIVNVLVEGTTYRDMFDPDRQRLNRVEPPLAIERAVLNGRDFAVTAPDAEY